MKRKGQREVLEQRTDSCVLRANGPWCTCLGYWRPIKTPTRRSWIKTEPLVGRLLILRRPWDHAIACFGCLLIQRGRNEAPSSLPELVIDSIHEANLSGINSRMCVTEFVDVFSTAGLLVCRVRLLGYLRDLLIGTLQPCGVSKGLPSLPLHWNPQLSESLRLELLWYRL
ncbi:hypothetical protein F4780DRAFT_500212 [Xylariomycetidae sp. FL0641]|nr:hypothetical protein F4780DRAFT_500212 [Xylariomycetidae sp. FL0641]